MWFANSANLAATVIPAERPGLPPPSGWPASESRNPVGRSASSSPRRLRLLGPGSREPGAAGLAWPG